MKYFAIVASVLVTVVSICCIYRYGYFGKNTATIPNSMTNKVTNTYFSVDVPKSWVAEDLTENKKIQDTYGAGVKNFTGFRPEGREVLFQHAIIVTDDSVEMMESAVMNTAKQENYSLINFETEKIRIPIYDGVSPSESFIFENKDDSSKYMSFWFFSKNGLTYTFLVNDSDLDRSTHVPFDDKDGVFEKSFKFILNPSSN